MLEAGAVKRGPLPTATPEGRLSWPGRSAGATIRGPGDSSPFARGVGGTVATLSAATSIASTSTSITSASTSITPTVAAAAVAAVVVPGVAASMFVRGALLAQEASLLEDLGFVLLDAGRPMTEDRDLNRAVLGA